MPRVSPRPAFRLQTIGPSSFLCRGEPKRRAASPLTDGPTAKKLRSRGGSAARSPSEMEFPRPGPGRLCGGNREAPRAVPIDVQPDVPGGRTQEGDIPIADGAARLDRVRFRDGPA